MATKKADEDTRTQAQKFKELAREVGADMDADEFDGLLKGTRGTKPPYGKSEYEADKKRLAELVEKYGGWPLT